MLWLTGAPQALAVPHRLDVRERHRGVRGLRAAWPAGTACAVESLTTGFLILLSVSQVVYIGPAIYYAYHRGRPNIAKGLMIGAAVTFALMAAS